MKNYKFRINGNQYEVEVLDIDGNMAKIEVNGTSTRWRCSVRYRRSSLSFSAVQAKVQKETKSVAGTECRNGKAAAVRAPLPGVILQVLVRPGDEVNAGQTLCTLETMKMENAIKAEAAGKVTAVNIAPGTIGTAG